MFKLLKYSVFSLIVVSVLGASLAAAIYYYLAPQLPDPETLHDIELQVPMRVFSSEGLLISEFGETKRTPARYEEIPDAMIKAFIAAEDDQFFHHNGVDIKGLLRAAIGLITTGEKRQGGSTITMQLARNFFLSNEKTYLRKLNEILLALKIERELSKEEIITLYLNKIFLGQRAYGVAAAAQVYYGAKLDELSLAQIAMIAGLPKAPSTTNPISNPNRAKIRRDYVLNRMLTLGYISEQSYAVAKSNEISATVHTARTELDAGYVAEMVRQEMRERYGNDIYVKGYKVYTTISAELQLAAQTALRQGLIDYDKRHGYRGPEGNSPLEQLDEGLESTVIGGLLPAVVTNIDEKSFTASLKDNTAIVVEWPEIEWAKKYIDERQTGPDLQAVSDILQIGDIIRVSKTSEDKWTLSQVPNAQGALVAPEPETGAIRALVGGFDFDHSKFNRATQAERQTGSSFKPFIYSAALEKGFTAASLINDAPVVFEDDKLEDSWRPENYSGKFYGPTRLRVALRNSRNLVSIRLLRSIGINYAINHASRFGFDKSLLPRDLSLSLGSLSLTPLELAKGYMVLANGGFATRPYLIQRIEDMNGEILFEAEPAMACLSCELKAAETQPNENNTELVKQDEPLLAPRVVNHQNIFLTSQLMRDVIRRGTAKRALSLKRPDLAGKTGTTNDQRDAWFAGFTQDIVAVAWVGFDDSTPLGPRETGASAALPLWIKFMEKALPLYPENPVLRPEGLVTVRIDRETGLTVGPGHKGAIFETFRTAYVPDKQSNEQAAPTTARNSNSPRRENPARPPVPPTDSGIPDQLF